MTDRLMATLSSRVYTQRTSDVGTGLFASDTIPPGVEILRVDEPLVSVLDTAHLRDTCSQCNLWFRENGHDQKPPSERLKTCLGCKITRYCCKVRSLFLFTPYHVAERSIDYYDSFPCQLFQSGHASLSQNISFVSSTLFVSSHTRSSEEVA